MKKTKGEKMKDSNFTLKELIEIHRSKNSVEALINIVLDKHVAAIRKHIPDYLKQVVDIDVAFEQKEEHIREFIDKAIIYASIKADSGLTFATTENIRLFTEKIPKISQLEYEVAWWKQNSKSWRLAYEEQLKGEKRYE